MTLTLAYFCVVRSKRPHKRKKEETYAAHCMVETKTTKQEQLIFELPLPDSSGLQVNLLFDWAKRGKSPTSGRYNSLLFTSFSFQHHFKLQAEAALATLDR